MMDCGDMKKISRADIQYGEPLPFSVHDTDGRLLLRKGYVITIPGHIEQLITRGVLIGDSDSGESAAPSSSSATRNSPPPPVSQPVYDQMDGLVLNLKHILTTALKSPEQIDLPARIRNLAGNLQALCQEDLDSALAAPYLDIHNPYIVVHQIMGAILTEIIAGRKGLDVGERLSLVSAALTRDIGQLAIQSELDKCNGPLPPALSQTMLEHPGRGVEILRRAGIADNTWLSAVRQHHERLDGSGYPQQLRENEVGLGARMLAIADTYSAMTKPRSYRSKAFHPQNALRDIYLKKDSHMDGELIQSLIKEIGMMPPGTIVRLKNGEIAVVKNRTSKATETTVFSVYDTKGMPLFSPIRRETVSPEFEITGMVPFAECRSAAVTIKRLWVK